MKKDLISDEKTPKKENISNNENDNLYRQILSYETTTANTDFNRSERMDDFLYGVLTNSYNTLKK